MKNLFFLFTVTFVSLSLYHSAQATPPNEGDSQTLIKATYHPGYEIHPKRRTFVLTVNGKMSLEVVDLRDSGTTVVKDLGHLSMEATTNLRKDIDAIPVSAKLVDPRAGEPPCVDTPTITVSVRTNAKSIEIYRRANCHKWDLDSHQGRFAAEFGALFLRFD